MPALPLPLPKSLYERFGEGVPPAPRRGEASGGAPGAVRVKTNTLRLVVVVIGFTAGIIYPIKNIILA